MIQMVLQGQPDGSTPQIYAICIYQATWRVNYIQTPNYYNDTAANGGGELGGFILVPLAASKINWRKAIAKQTLKVPGTEPNTNF